MLCGTLARQAPPLAWSPPPCRPPHLQVVVMAAQVGSDPILGQQRHQLLDHLVGGPVLSNGPHWVVPSHQHVVLLGCRQLLLEPGQLHAGQLQVLRLLGLLAEEVIRVATQCHCVQYEDGHGHVGLGDLEAQVVERSREVPVEGTEVVDACLEQRSPGSSSRQWASLSTLA